MEIIRLAIVGYGKIAHDQHHPAIKAGADFELVAVASPGADVTGVANFESLEALLAQGPAIDAVALCTPAEGRSRLARIAMAHGKHVLMEKPPCTTLAEVEGLREEAARHAVTLFASWHSRHAAGVVPAKRWLALREIRQVEIEWKEDVRVWHPGQAWIWEPGGMGVFDPGINALSIATAILPNAFHLVQAKLRVPANCQTPISASLDFVMAASPDCVEGEVAPGHTGIHAEFDFDQHGKPPTWNIHIETDAGTLALTEGGSHLRIDGESQDVGPDAEYIDVYAHFAGLIRAEKSDIDISPLRHIADAMMLGHRRQVEDFVE